MTTLAGEWQEINQTEGQPMNNPAKVAEWKSDYYDEWGDQGNLQLRYPYWQPIAAINQNRIYAFDIVAAFYDPQGQCYYAARTYATINKGDYIAQLVIVPIITPTPVKVERLDSTARGTAGIGSTDG